MIKSITPRDEGVDPTDHRSGGLVPSAKVTARAGYQIPFAALNGSKQWFAATAGGIVTIPAQAGQVTRNDEADIALPMREFLREPSWPLRGARVLRVNQPRNPPVQRLHAW